MTLFTCLSDGIDGDHSVMASEHKQVLDGLFVINNKTICRLIDRIIDFMMKSEEESCDAQRGHV
jgi:hypothetical protein